MNGEIDCENVSQENESYENNSQSYCSLQASLNVVNFLVVR